MRNQSTFKNKLPTVFLVGTPIGNLEDVSFRAINTLNNVDYILCEDTRTSKTFLDKYKIHKPLLSLHMHNEKERISNIFNILSDLKNIAIISDAGCPVISDPGAFLVQQLISANVCNVTSVNVGPAYIHAIVASGFTNTKNYFHGFVNNKSKPSKNKEIREMIENNQNTIISFYESVHRIKDTIVVLSEVLQHETQVLIARELTKLNEQYIQGNIKELHEYVDSNEFVEKGEFVIVINNLSIASKTYSELDIIKLVDQFIIEGLKLKQACEKVSSICSLSKNDIYNLYIKNN